MSGQWDRIELVGDRNREEFLPIVERLDRFTPAPLTDNGHGTSKEVKDGRDLSSVPVTVVVLQSGPDQYPRGEFLRLHGENPLARFVCVYGPWCEADGRTRDDWPFSIRVPVWRAGPRLQVETNRSPPPLTASRDESFHADYGEFIEVAGTRGGIQIDSPDGQLRRLLADALGIENGTGGTETSRMLFDIDPWTERRREELQSCLGKVGASSTLPLVGFPEPTLLQELRALGLKQYWPKLGTLHELQRTLIGMA